MTNSNKNVILGLAIMVVIGIIIGLNSFLKSPNENDNKNTTLTVIFDSDGGSYVENATVKNGNKVSIPEPPFKEGYTFTGWSLNGSEYNFDTPVKDDMTLVAIYTKNDENPTPPPVTNEYNVTFVTGTTDQIQPQVVKDGELVTKPADLTREGYVFDGWYNGTSKYDFNSPVKSDLTLTAKWVKDTQDKEKYVVTFDTNGGSNIESATVIEGKTVNKPVNPTKQGYDFVEWQLNGKTYDFSSPVKENITLTAIWETEKTKYLVKFDTVGGSTITSVKVTEGKTVSKPATPTKKGYTFVEWQLNGKTYNFASPVKKNITLTAVWSEKTKYNIIFMNDGKVVKEKTIYKGDQIGTLPSVSKSGATLLGWYNGTKKYTSTVRLTLPEGKNVLTLTAKWEEKERTYTYVVTKIDDFSTDRYITLYADGKALSISEVEEIQYTNGTLLSDTKENGKFVVGNADLKYLDSSKAIRVKLTTGKVVTATPK